MEARTGCWCQKDPNCIHSRSKSPPSTLTLSLLLCNRTIFQPQEKSKATFIKGPDTHGSFRVNSNTALSRHQKAERATLRPGHSLPCCDHGQQWSDTLPRRNTSVPTPAGTTRSTQRPSEPEQRAFLIRHWTLVLLSEVCCEGRSGRNGHPTGQQRKAGQREPARDGFPWILPSGDPGRTGRPGPSTAVQLCLVTSPVNTRPLTEGFSSQVTQHRGAVSLFTQVTWRDRRGCPAQAAEKGRPPPTSRATGSPRSPVHDCLLPEGKRQSLWPGSCRARMQRICPNHLVLVIPRTDPAYVALLWDFRPGPRSVRQCGRAGTSVGGQHPDQRSSKIASNIQELTIAGPSSTSPRGPCAPGPCASQRPQRTAPRPTRPQLMALLL
nr:uncharacterized protein LOC114100005 [Marmota flaviventris]